MNPLSSWVAAPSLSRQGPLSRMRGGQGDDPPTRPALFALPPSLRRSCQMSVFKSMRAVSCPGPGPSRFKFAQVLAARRQENDQLWVALASLPRALPSGSYCPRQQRIVLLSKATADRRECGAEHWPLHVGRVSVGIHRDLGLPTRLFVAPLSPTSSASEACAVCVR